LSIRNGSYPAIMVKKMSARLIWAIVSTVLEEAALAVIVLMGLPRLGINIPLAGLIALMVAWVVVSVIIYRMGSRALSKRPLTGLPGMVGSRGKVVSPLAPKGVIRIKGELWEAKSAGRRIKVGEEVMVVGQDGLRLVVRKHNAGDLEGPG
jgi:membrane-bound ClpP family serine protease